MPTFSISIDLGHILPPNASLTPDTFPALAAAVQQAGLFAYERWQDYALGRPLPSGAVINNQTGEYARSITQRETGPFSTEVFTVLPYARLIEEGQPQRDMKKMLSTSLKVRLTKDGRRYLIIPFEHTSRSGLPDEVKDWFAGKATSHITARIPRQNAIGVHDMKTRKLIMVPGWRYSWGDRVGKADLATMGITDKAKAKRLEGIYKFQNPGGAAGGGAKAGSHTSYVSFRKMVEGSRGWIAKAQPGKFPARIVADQVRPLAEKLFEAGVTEDINAILNRG